MVERKKGFQFFAHCIMILITLFCLLPFLLLIVSSFTDEATLIRDGYSFFPQKLSLNAYRYLLVDSTAIVRGYLISITVTVIGTIANLLITVMFAYPLSRRDLPMRNFFAFFLFFTMLFNGGLVPTYMMWTQTFHIKNTLFALLIPGLLMSAFNVIIVYNQNTIHVSMPSLALSCRPPAFLHLWGLAKPFPFFQLPECVPRSNNN